MRKFHPFLGGAIVGFVFALFSFSYGLIHEVAIGRKSPFLGIGRETASKIDKTDVFGLGDIGWHVAKGAHTVLTKFLGFGNTNALGLPLIIAIIIIIFLSSIMCGLIGNFILTIYCKVIKIESDANNS